MVHYNTTHLNIFMRYCDYYTHPYIPFENLTDHLTDKNRPKHPHK